MQSQKFNEEERIEEARKDYSKARQFPHSIIGRKRLRELRFILYHLGINVHIPMNSASFTDDYCLKYAGKETEEGLLLMLRKI